MLVPDISEEPDLTPRHKHGHTQRMDGRIPKALVIEATTSVQPIKVFLVCFSPEEIEIADFEVGEELTIVVVAAVAGVEEPVQIGVWVDEFGVGVYEGAGTGPEGGEGAGIVEDVHVEAVFHVVIAHEAEDVVVNVTEEVDLQTVSKSLRTSHTGRTCVGFDTPIPVKIFESWVFVEEAAVPSTHVAVADHPTFADANSAQILQAVHESSFVDPVWQRPVLERNDFVVDLCRSQVSCSGLALSVRDSAGNDQGHAYLELIAERLIVEKHPWVLVLSIPVVLQLSHALHDTFQLRIAHQADESRSRLLGCSAKQRDGVGKPGRGRNGELVVRVVLQPFSRVRWMLPCSFSDRSDDLIRTDEMMRNIDVNDLTAPGLRRGNNPDEKCEDTAYQHSNLSPTDDLTDSYG